VDELPDVIMQNFNVQKDMNIDALPYLKLDPKDEKIKIFHNLNYNKSRNFNRDF